MRRPVYHDKSWAKRDELLLHIANLETYATEVEQQRDNLSRALGEAKLQLSAKKPTPAAPSLTALLAHWRGLGQDLFGVPR